MDLALEHTIVYVFPYSHAPRVHARRGDVAVKVTFNRCDNEAEHWLAIVTSLQHTKVSIYLHPAATAVVEPQSERHNLPDCRE
jgi:hypothetical protein